MKWVKVSIPVPEVLKWLAPSLPDAGSGWTVVCPIPPHAFKMSAWSDFTPLCDREVLLWCHHIPRCQHHTKGGFNGQCSPPHHAWCSHSGKGMAWASLDHDEALEDDFQTQHMLDHHVMWQEDTGHRSSAKGRLECSRGSSGQCTGYRMDIGEEQEMLETVDPTWQTTHWLQLMVQSILDDEVPWYEYVTPLMMGAEGTALSLAKHLLTIWRWSVRVQGQDICPPR